MAAAWHAGDEATASVVEDEAVHNIAGRDLHAKLWAGV